MLEWIKTLCAIKMKWMHPASEKDINLGGGHSEMLWAARLCTPKFMLKA